MSIEYNSTGVIVFASALIGVSVSIKSYKMLLSLFR